jgi:RHS repeat-associated protein
VRKTGPDGTVTRYLYDGDDLLMELDGAGNPIREYTYLPGVDRPLSVRVSATGASYYYATDHPANVTGLIDGSNNGLVNEYEYGPWGEVNVVREDIQQPLRYAAREWDGTAGLYQVRARWYDPHTGRFVSEDPIGLAGGINLYRYAANNPINATDPYGLCELWATIRTRYFSDGTTEVEVLGYFWKGDCENRRGNGSLHGRLPCRRDANGFCVTYVPVEDWQRIHDVIQSIPDTPEICAGAKASLLSLWNQGTDAARIRFWDGFDLQPNGSQRYGQRLSDAGGSFVEFDSYWFFEDPRLAPHEGLHVYYNQNPHPTLIGRPLHALIYQQDRGCAWQ